MPRRTIHIDLDAMTDEWAAEVRLSDMLVNANSAGAEAIARQAFQEGVYRGILETTRHNKASQMRLKNPIK